MGTVGQTSSPQTTPHGIPSSSRPAEILSRHADWILKRAAHISRRKGIPEDEIPDFAIWVALRLMDRDYAILKACRQPHRLRAYLNAVIRNLLKDYRDHLWGKWRPSSLAARLGPSAVALERLCRRDGLKVREAIEFLTRQGNRHGSPEHLERLAGRLKPRPRIKLRPLRENDTGFSWNDPSGPERRALRARLLQRLKSAMASLDGTDLELLHLHYREGQSLVAIARRRGLPQRAIYSQKERCLKRLRGKLQSDGWRWRDIAPVLAEPAMSTWTPTPATDRSPTAR